MELFYKLSIDTINTILETGLPKSTQNLLWYLCKLNPFGDRPVQITWEQAKEAIGISKATFYRALAKLQQTGLLVCGSLKGFAVSLKNETRVSELGIKSQECGSQSQKRNSTIYTDLKTFSYHPDCQSEEKCKIPDPESNTNDRDSLGKPKTQGKPTTAEVRQNLTAKSLGQGKEKSSAAARTKKRTKELLGFDWLPEGPWNIDGKLDPNFRDWLAKNWVKRYGGDFHDKQADVLAHFRKDPANLVIRWEQYQNEFVHRVENTQIRLANGCQINEATQQSLITHQRAVTAVLPPEMNPVVVAPVVRSVLSPVPEKVIRGLESVEPLADLTSNKNSDTDNCEASPISSPWDNSAESRKETPSKNSEEVESSPKTEEDEYTTLEDGTRLKVFKRKEKPEFEPASPEQVKSLGDMMQSFLKSFGGERKAPAPKPLSELEELNQWLHNPALREEAINRARRSPNYKYCYELDQIIAAEEF